MSPETELILVWVLMVLWTWWWCSCLQLNTQLGTALINAYRRTPEVSSRSDPRSLALALERADGVAAQLASRRQANQQTYALLAAMHAEVRVPVSTNADELIFSLQGRVGRAAATFASYPSGLTCPCIIMSAAPTVCRHV
jgi:hypothetical protein